MAQRAQQARHEPDRRARDIAARQVVTQRTADPRERAQQRQRLKRDAAKLDMHRTGRHVDVRPRLLDAMRSWRDGWSPGWARRSEGRWILWLTLAWGLASVGAIAFYRITH